ncbi:hypothetical protein I552_8245 [Mycobacterium xenopi 3993]|nr:hypothetical protein I552_8245 [Mycobacterium xenopi 3993]
MVHLEHHGLRAARGIAELYSVGFIFSSYGVSRGAPDLAALRNPSRVCETYSATDFWSG